MSDTPIKETLAGLLRECRKIAVGFVPWVKRTAVKAFRGITSFPRRFTDGCRRWYAYNKQYIPLLFIIVAGVIFTAFLDFSIDRGSDLPPFIFKSHIAAIQRFVSSTMGNLSGFFLFAIYLIGIIQIFNAATFGKKRAPASLYLITALTVAQIVFVTLYTATFFLEDAARADYAIDEIARRSYSIMIAGAAFLAVGTVFAWFYVDRHYVKESEE